MLSLIKIPVGKTTGAQIKHRLHKIQKPLKPDLTIIGFYNNNTPSPANNAS